MCSYCGIRLVRTVTTEFSVLYPKCCYYHLKTMIQWSKTTGQFLGKKRKWVKVSREVTRKMAKEYFPLQC